MSYGYNPDFARAYNTSFSSFAREVAPRIHDFYLSRPPAENHRRVLDLCCGTGQAVRFFADRGFQVTGIDLSEPMLAYARENAGPHLASGAATFHRADASGFRLDTQFGLVISTFDALNHLPGKAELASCFHCVAAVTDPGGYFIFDLNTRTGAEKWNRTTVEDGEHAFLVRRGSYDGDRRAEATITGFVREPDGRYRRFEQRVQNHLFELSWVARTLWRSGWSSVAFANIRDLSRTLRHPERESRIFVVAQRSEDR